MDIQRSRQWKPGPRGWSGRWRAASNRYITSPRGGKVGGAEGRVQSGMGQECGGGEGREGRMGGWLGERWRAAPPKLHDTAAALFLRLLGGRRRAQHDANRLIEHILEALLRQRGALEVLCRADGLCHLLPLLQTDRCLVLLAQLRNRGPIRSQVELRADEDERAVWAVVLQLGEPLLFHVLVRGARDEGEGDEEDVRLRVRERSQPIVVFLPCCVPQPKVDRLPIHHHIRAVVVEDGGDVVLWEGIRGVRYE
mmetsp:Transcript_45288/g.145710  ORF Transcript_45288/g.145710 Transcript_45288/m.145710 type:complete len:253 (+) Transcript_45288:112-870(+)